MHDDGSLHPLSSSTYFIYTSKWRKLSLNFNYPRSNTRCVQYKHEMFGIKRTQRYWSSFPISLSLSLSLFFKKRERTAGGWKDDAPLKGLSTAPRTPKMLISFSLCRCASQNRQIFFKNLRDSLMGSIL